ncbi:hypothetical protein E6H34_07750 [Candidatus Bathyarchaeota archaeon]|nr:MAG: hypothetical protein E6H34_07750 [Candidatus Bathyarchaeota archaeon]
MKGNPTPTVILRVDESKPGPPIEGLTEPTNFSALPGSSITPSNETNSVTNIFSLQPSPYWRLMVPFLYFS